MHFGAVLLHFRLAETIVNQEAAWRRPRGYPEGAGRHKPLSPRPLQPKPEADK
jgi:hypothetical protein